MPSPAICFRFVQIAAMLIAGCGVDAAPSCLTDASGPVLSEAVVMHACLHGRAGPFRVVTGGVSVDEAPDVSRSHTLFSVLATTGHDMHLRYLPTAPGDHVLFTAGAELMSAKQGSRWLALEQRTVDCDVLPSSYLLPLPVVDPVELRLRADGDRAAVVIESLAGWGAEGWRHACGAPAASAPDAGACRTSGPCSRDAECCSYCHDYDHCH